MSTENTDKPEEVNDDSKKAVTGSLLGALGFMEGKPAESSDPDTKEEPNSDSSDPNEPEAAKPTSDDPDSEPKEEEDGVVLSAKDIRVKQKEAQEPKPPEQPKEPKPAEPKAEEKKDPEPEPVDKLEGLAKNERETVELLKFGEGKSMTEKGSSDKLIEFYVRRHEIRKKLEAENDKDFDEDYEVSSDPRYKKWLRANKPPVEVSDLEEIRNEKLLSTAEDRAFERLRKEQEKKDEKWEEVMKEQNLEKARPQIERTVNDFSDRLLADMPEEVTANLKAGKKWEQVEEEHPLEAPIVKSVLNEFSDRAEILVSMYQGVLDIDPRNPLHSDLSKFVRTQSDVLAKQPPEKTMRHGKNFVKPQDYRGDENTWTFTQEDVLTMLRKQATLSVNSRIEAEKKKLEAYMKRNGTPAPEQHGEARPSTQSPRVSPSASGTPSKQGAKKSGGLFEVLMG